MYTKTKIAKAVQLTVMAGALGMAGAAWADEEQALLAADEAQAAEEVKQEVKQDTQQLESDQDTDLVEENVERISVTGSRISRTDLEGASQLVVITEEDMKAQGFVTAFDALKGVTQNTGVVEGNEAGAMGGFTGAADVISLRGFGPGYTLVLINGRRVAENPTPYQGNSNFVNMNGIPTAAIARIEVLADGASAIYGSDAVAGVVNIILKDNVDYTQITGQIGTSLEGGGEKGRFQLVSGTYGDRYSVTGGFEYFNQQPIFGKDRSSMDSVRDIPGGIGDLNQGILGFDNINGKTIDLDKQKCADSGSGYKFTWLTSNPDYQYCGTDSVGDNSIQNERENIGTFLSATYDLNDDIELYTDLMFGTMKSVTRGGRHTIAGNVMVDNFDGTGNLAGMIPGDLPGYGHGDNFDYQYWQRTFDYHELGARESHYDEWTLSGTIGLNGYLPTGHQWGAYFSESRANTEAFHDQLSQAGVDKYFLGHQSTALHQYFGLQDGRGLMGDYQSGQHALYGMVTPEIKAEITGQAFDKSDSYSRTLAVDLSGEMFDMPYGYAYFAAVAEFNRQGYDLKVDDMTRNGEWNGWAGTEGGGDRDRWALAGEFSLPLYHGLELNLAGRYDEYDDGTSDVGGRFSPSAKLTYRPMREVMLRASYNESFRAPDMHYVFASDSTFYSPALDWVACADNWSGDEEFEQTYANCHQYNSYQSGTRSGSLELEEEEGKSYAFGIVADPIDNLSLTFDWYRLELNNQISNESMQGVLNAEYDCKYGDKSGEEFASYCAMVDSKISRSDQNGSWLGSDLESVELAPINRAFYAQEGIDMSANYFLDTNYGGFNFNLGWTHILSTEMQHDADSPKEDIRDLAGNFEARSRVNGSMTFMRERLSTTVRVSRTGSVPLYSQPESNIDRDEDGAFIGYNNISRTDAYYTMNLTLGYSFSQQLSGTFTAVNLLNEMPEDDTMRSWPFYNTSAHPGAGVGAQFLAEMSYRF